MNGAALLPAVAPFLPEALAVLPGPALTVLVLVLKGTLVLLGGFVASRLLARSSAAARHLAWTATLAALLLVPAAAVLLPGPTLAVLPAPVADPGAGSAGAGGLRDATPERATPAPGAASPGAASPGAVSSGAVSPGVASPGAVSSGAVSPGVASPGVASPGAASSGAASSGVSSSGAASFGASSPGAVSSGAVSSGAVSSGAVFPGAAGTGATPPRAPSPPGPAPGAATPFAAVPRPTAEGNAGGPVAAAPGVLPLRPGLFLVALYLAGVAVLLGWLLIGLATVAGYTRRGRPPAPAEEWEALAASLARRLELRRPVRLVVSDRVRVPMVWGFRRPVVLLPPRAEAWPEAHRRDALLHELAHVRRGDWPLQLAARLVVAFHWFHPLAWTALSHLRLEAERACDDRVLEAGSGSCDYAERLVDLARGARLRPETAVAMSGRSQLSRRIRSLLDAGRRRSPLGRGTAAALAAVLVLPALALGAVQLAPSEVPPAGERPAWWAGSRAEGAGPGAGADAGGAVEHEGGREHDADRDHDADADHHLDLDHDTDLDHDVDRDHDTDLDHEAEIALSEADLDALGARADAAGERGGGLASFFAALGFGRDGDGRRAAGGSAGRIAGDRDEALLRTLTPLMRAAHRGDGDAVRARLEAGDDPNQVLHRRGTPLIHAALSGDAAGVAALLQAGADPGLHEVGPERPDDLPRTALGAAARSGSLEVVDRLLDAGAAVDAAPPGDATPLMIAARHGHVALVRRLVDRGADVNAVVVRDGTPLIEAARSGSREAVQVLLDAGADPRIGVEWDGNPLIAAARQGDSWMVERFLAAGADPEAWVEGDESGWFHAVAGGDPEVVRLMLEAGADPEAVWEGDDNPLLLAVRHGHRQVVEMLLAAGARPDRAVAGDGNALVQAASRGALDQVERLLSAGADPDAAVDGDGSPLIVAAAAGRLAVVDRLLSAGADPDLAVAGDGSPLIAAAAAGHLDVVRRLLAAGADVDRVVPGDENPLIQAAGAGHLGVVRHLVEEAGADVGVRVEVDVGWPPGQRREVRTPLSMARRGGHGEVVRYLRSRGATEGE